MYTFEPYEQDGQFGQILLIQESGEGIAMHRHDDPDYRHSITVIEGVCRCYGPGKKWSVVLYERQTHIFTDEQQEHEIVAIRGSTRLLAIWINGKPPGLDQVPKDELVGTIRRPLTRGQ